MLTKNINFDDVTIQDLKNIVVKHEEGQYKGYIIQQLDRARYLQLNKALETLGGKWNKKDKCHIFPDNPLDGLFDIMKTGTATVVRDGFFETPRKVAEQMWELLPVDFRMSEEQLTVLEPCAGNGKLIDFLLEKFKQDDILFFELNETRLFGLKQKYPDCMYIEGDFLAYPDPKYNYNGVDLVFMNPPFEEGQDMMFVRKAHKYLSDGGHLVSVMSPHFTFANDKKSKEFRDWLKTLPSVRKVALPDNSFKESGTMVNAVLLHIAK